MTYDDEGSLFEEEFDFVDEVEDEEEQTDEVAEEAASEDEEQAPKSKSKPRTSPTRAKRTAKADDEAASAADETSAEKEAEPAEPPGPPSDHVVHIYEHGKFRRTIAREFTGDDAEAFATEFNRTSNPHSRQAVAADRDKKPPSAI